MKIFKDWTDEQIKSIKMPVLIVYGDQYDILLDHVIRMHRLFPNARLAILPRNHGGYMGEVMTANVDKRVVQAFMTIISALLRD